MNGYLVLSYRLITDTGRVFVAQSVGLHFKSAFLLIRHFVFSWHSVLYSGGWTLEQKLLSTSQTAKFMGPTWGPSGSCRPQLGPMLAPWTLLSGIGDFKQCALMGRPTTPFICPCHDEFILGNITYICISVISQYCDGVGCWNPSSWTTRTRLLRTVSTTVADDLATHVAMASAGIVLIRLSRNIMASTPKEWRPEVKWYLPKKFSLKLGNAY